MQGRRAPEGRAEEGPRGGRTPGADTGRRGAYLRTAAGRGERRLSRLRRRLGSTAAQGPGGDSCRPRAGAAGRSPAPASPAPASPAPVNPSPVAAP